MIELMAVLVVAGILVSVGMPAFGSLKRSLVQRQAREEMRQRLREARQVAVTRHNPVVVVFGNGVQTTDITDYTVHFDTNGDRIRQSTELITWYELPKGSKLETSGFAPIDSLIFDISGALWPGTIGGRLFFSGANTPDTLELSATGMVFRP